MKPIVYLICFLLTLAHTSQSFSQQAPPGAALQGAAPYRWVKFAGGRMPAGAIPYGNQVVPQDDNLRMETAVARGAYVTSTQTIKYLAVSNGRACKTWMINHRSRRGQELPLKDCEIMVPQPGYTVEWKNVESRQLSRMSDEQLVQLGAVQLEIMLAGQGNFSGFITRIRNEDGNVAAAFYGRLAHLPQNRPRAVRQVDSVPPEGRMQILLLKQSAGAVPAPTPPE
ncbi:hypothetical protein Pan241w_31030 [Gimesia alba]|uniref:DUF4412 domain-containing protein n=1 Tax=Gimesia alba TaxID=2527973 RepID=A0A517RGK5_9PLAN|nr:hypothetical protein [Gimesia alba]QDT43008.1 hypothetical protein Pan241w_31030 [Gimesia alba]